MFVWHNRIKTWLKFKYNKLKLHAKYVCGNYFLNSPPKLYIYEQLKLLIHAPRNYNDANNKSVIICIINVCLIK